MFSYFKRKNVASVEDIELQHFLKSKHCNGCSRHCPLSSQKCGRGKNPQQLKRRIIHGQPLWIDSLTLTIRL